MMDHMQRRLLIQTGLVICVMIMVLNMLQVAMRTHSPPPPTEPSSYVEDSSEGFEHPEPELLYLPEMTSAMSCRDESRDAIFFTESSGSGLVKARFVCGLESAARTHPHADVYLLMVYSGRRLDMAENAALRNVMSRHPNVRVLRVDLQRLLSGSVLEEFYLSGKLERSKFRAVHTSDIVRIFTLWRYGGKYFDLDTMLVRDLTSIRQFVTFMDPTHGVLANGMMAFEKHSPIAMYAIQMMLKIWNGEDWQQNGPNALTYAFLTFCNVSRVQQISSHKCKALNVNVIPHSAFFPVLYNELQMYFEESRSNETMTRIRSATLLGIHVGNNIVKDNVVRVESRQAYGLLAQQYCPRAYWSCGSHF